jgi:hypothetical protein
VSIIGLVVMETSGSIVGVLGDGISGFSVEDDEGDSGVPAELP